ncbi:MAG TPA: 2-amino-4-hydroxy-6-hydroxymethyldihydropteridine diphosphokinase [Acidobacteriota bacterium]
MSEAWIGLGSNLDDRRAYLRRAAESLSRLGETRFSSIYETAPVWAPGYSGPGGKFLNLVCRLQTDLDVVPLLAEMLRIERDNGRVRSDSDSRRTLDLDLLAFGRVCFTLGQQHRASGPSLARLPVALDLTVPHPRMHFRPFVLVPMLEIDKTWRHPLLGRTAADLMAGLDQSGVKLHCACRELFL